MPVDLDAQAQIDALVEMLSEATARVSELEESADRRAADMQAWHQSRLADCRRIASRHLRLSRAAAKKADAEIGRLRAALAEEKSRADGYERFVNERWEAERG